ncbi:PREDICTED: heat shock protein 30C-like [Nanorana parkeri]|uniref:heat shock protein 30C-like n=1 Tax=Nanorana parkeri TaxID=125878 RepID=UPI000854D94D|nr:PREDICTED: heat shock protein 30C-like [Nanorana parkeri]XP_018430126.1 PREDICTED: heat shock protein 30C-like [Nanorana parkeri]XP_018430127.1 PREDICTED: heat shock protein 30C-like [Nanorana parkeri]
MFPLSLLQSSHSPVYVYSRPELPHWTATRLILRQLEDDMLGVSSDMERRMQRLHQAYRLLDNDPEMRRSGHPDTPQDKSPAEGKDGKEDFQLSLDVSPFSPEELTVRTEGRRLIVAGKYDKKREAENGGFFQEYREWRREAELPQDINPEDVLCSMSKDGRLHFWAPRLALPAAKERAIPITIEQSPGDSQGSDPENQNHRGQQEQDLPQNSS